MTAKKYHQHPQDCRPGDYEPPLEKGEVYCCPGDPLCAYTELARKYARERAMPAMWRLSQLWPNGSYRNMQAYWEKMYIAVCTVLDEEVMEPVEGYEWPNMASGATELAHCTETTS